MFQEPTKKKKSKQAWNEAKPKMSPLEMKRQRVGKAEQKEDTGHINRISSGGGSVPGRTASLCAVMENQTQWARLGDMPHQNQPKKRNRS